MFFRRWLFFPDSLIDGCCGQKARAVQDVPHPHFTSKPDVMEWVKRDYLNLLSMGRVLLDECVHLGSLRIKPRGRLNCIIKLADNRNASGEAGVLPAGKFTDLFPKQTFQFFEKMSENLLLHRRWLGKVGAVNTFWSFSSDSLLKAVRFLRATVS